jgi:hypothetical protein
MLSKEDFQTAANGICPGPDLDWFAVDKRGNVAAFCNAGFASVPLSVFSSYTLYIRTVDAIALLQKTGDALWSWSRPTIHETWDEWSQRGLFGYDWNHCTGQPGTLLPYRFMTRPSVPISIDSMPRDIADYIASTRLPVEDFSYTAEILI